MYNLFTAPKNVFSLSRSFLVGKMSLVIERLHLAHIAPKPFFLVLGVLTAVSAASPLASHFFPQAATSPLALRQQTEAVLGAQTSPVAPSDGYVSFNVPTVFNDTVALKSSLQVDGTATFNGPLIIKGKQLDLGDGTITASNVVYNMKAGNGVAISAGQNPTISNNGVLSFQGATGAVTLTAGSGITIDGTKISSTLSSPNTFGTISDGTNSFSAGSTNDTLIFTAGSGVTITTDTTNKKLTFSANGGLSGLTTNGVLYATSATTATTLAPGTSGYILQSNGTGSAPSWVANAAANPSFASISTGTNTTATMTVGTGGTLTYSGSGTINATQILGGTWAVPGTIGSTTPNTGAFTNLSASGTFTLSGFSTGILHSSSGTMSSSAIGLASSDVTGTLGVGNGGTGLTSFTTGDLLYANSTSSLAKLSDIASGSCLLSGGVGVAPSWGSCSNSVSYWNLTGGALSPINSTTDLLIGGTATSSAKFAFTNVNSGTPTASIAGTLVVAGDGSIQTTNDKMLTLGGTTTGNIALSPLNSTGYVSINGSLRLTQGASAADSFTTPQNSSVITKINIPLYDPGAYNQILAMGLPSSADTNARVISLFDARAGSHQPTFSILSPDENQVAGLSWEGTNNTLYLKNSLSTGNIDFSFNNANAVAISPNLGTLIYQGYGPTSGNLGGFSHLAIGAGGSTPNAASVAWGDGTGWKLNFGNTGSGFFTPTFTFVDTGSMGIGTTNPLSSTGLDIEKNGLGNSILVANQLGSGDIFTASASGTTKFTIANDGTLKNNLIPYATDTYDLGTSSLEWNNLYVKNIVSPSLGGVSGYLQLNSGALSPTNITNDLVLGGTSTSSAKFQISGTTGAILAAAGITSSGTIDFSSLTTNGILHTTGGTGVLGVSAVALGSEVSGTLPTTSGGTGLTSFTAGDMLYYASGSTLSKIAIGSSNQVLTVSGGVPTWTSNPTAGNGGGSGSFGYFQRNTGVLSPTTISDDFVLGATATASANVKLAGTSGTTSFIASGNVGIGTTNPSATLEVAGDTRVFNPTNQYGNVYSSFDLFLDKTWNSAATFSAAGTTFSNTSTLDNTLSVSSSYPLTGWKYRQTLTVDNTGNASTLTNYQVVFTIDTATPIAAGKMNSDCSDIRITDTDGSTLLSYWIESGCNSASTKIWTKVPSITGSSTKTIYIYYGRPSATAASNTNTFVRTITGNQLAYRLDESLASSNAVDASGNGLDGTPTGTTVVAGKFGNARQFNGTSDQVAAPSNALLNNSVFTFTAWIYVTDVSIEPRQIIGPNSGTGGVEWRVDQTTGKLSLLKEGTVNLGTSTGAVSLNTWTHVAVTYDSSGNVAFYINGTASGTSTNLQSFTFNQLHIGNGRVSETFQGDIDEVHIFNKVLSSAEVADEAANYGYFASNTEYVRAYSSPEPSVTVGGGGGQASYLTGLQSWTSETIDAGSGNTYQPNLFTVAYTLDGSDNIQPKFQILGSNTGAFAGEETIYPAGTGTFYQNGGTYSITSGVQKSIANEVTTAYRYWKVKAYLDTGATTTDTPTISSIRLQSFKALVLNKTGQYVGVGTTAPTANLDINGDLNVSTYATISASLALGYASAPAGVGNAIFAGNVGIGTSNPAGLLDVNSLFDVFSSGKVGIGTTSPLGMLDLRSSLGTQPIASLSGQTAFAGLVVDNKGVGDLFTASTSGMSRFVITQNGAVGIGTGAPSRNLDIVGNAVNNGTGTASQLSIYGTSSTSNRLNIGYNTTSNYGFIEAVNQSVAWQNLLLQPSGGNVAVGANLGVGNTTSFNAALDFGASLATNKIYLYDGASDKYGLGVAGNTLQIYSGAAAGTNATIQFGKYDGSTLTEFMRLMNGSLGIGTTAPLSQSGIDVTKNGLGNSIASFNQTGLGDILTASASGATKFVVKNDGKTGIGTANPTYVLDVQGSVAATAAAQIYNSNSTANSGGLIIKLGFTGSGTTPTSQTTGNNFVRFMDGNGNSLGSIDSNGGTGISYNGNGLDMAEYFLKKDTQEALLPGDTVCLDVTGGVTKCTSGQSIVGIISEHPSFVGGVNRAGDPRYVLVGLVGQLPAKISTANGTITSGDPLAIASDSGVLVKAVKAGQIVGHAMQSSAEQNSNGQIMVSVQPSWYDPTFIASATSSVLGASTAATLNQDVPLLTAQDATISGTLNVLGRATLTDLGITGSITNGLLTIHGLTGEINTMAGDLRLQSEGLGGVDILNGLVTIDTKGNIATQGVLSAQTVKAKNFVVTGDTTGSAAISAGESTVSISAPAMKATSKVFLTPTTVTSQPLSVTQKADGSFTVEIPTPEFQNITFDWWIVGTQ